VHPVRIRAGSFAGEAMDAGLVKAAQQAIEVLLKLKGVDITLIPGKGTAVEQPGGGYNYGDTTALAPQRFAIRDLQKGGTGKNPGTSDTGVTVLNRQLTLVGRVDAIAEVGDYWVDDENRYRIDELVIDNEYKKQWLVTQVGPDPHYG
jgi:hypothetical protein